VAEILLAARTHAAETFLAWFTSIAQRGRRGALMKIRNSMVILGLCAGLIGGMSSVYAEETAAKKPLDEAFDQTVIVPFDYQGKAFVNGQKIDVYGDYSMVHRNGRVLVPIRLMSFLATQVDYTQGTWEAAWQAQRPNEVVLTNAQLKKTIKFTVNDKTMLVNNKPYKMDVAPQTVDGRIVLPLRSAAEALGKQIDWLDGLILMGNEPIHLQHPQTTAIKSRIKAQLADKRERVDYEKAVSPLTKLGNASYYVKRTYHDTGVIETLMKQEDGKQAGTALKLPGNPQLSGAKLVNQELFYLSTVDGQGTLYVHDLQKNQSHRIAAVGSWDPSWGWLGEVRYVDGQLYVILHSGDNTMGSETLYRVENGELKRAAHAKSFINYAIDGQELYAANFHPMFDPANNLSRTDMATGQVTVLGQPGYAYGISRTITDQSVSYRTNAALYVTDDYIYALGYRESDPKDVSAVYRINRKDQSQKRLTAPTSEFWMVNDRIYYIDAGTGNLRAVAADGGNDRTLVHQNVMNVQLHDGSLYYTVNAGDSPSGVGVLYQYKIGAGQQVKRSDRSVTSYYVGKTGLYYVSSGYDAGLYRADADGRNVRLVNDSIESAAVSDAGVAYTLTYEEGIFSVK
jgi:hypothetical protein